MGLMPQEEDIINQQQLDQKIFKAQLETAKIHIQNSSTEIAGVSLIEVDKVFEILDEMKGYAVEGHNTIFQKSSNEMDKITQKVEIEKADKKYDTLVNGAILSAAKKGERSCCIDAKEMIPFLKKKLKDNGYKLKHHKSESDGIYPASDFWEIEW